MKKNDFHLRMTNASDYVTNGQAYQVFPNGIKVCQINLPQGIEYSKREKYIYSVGLMCLSLNPDATENMIYDFLLSITINRKVMLTELSSATLSKLIRMIFKQKEKVGTLELIENKVRKIIFDEKYNLSKIEKIEIGNKEMGLLKKQQTTDRIYSAIVDWNQPTKITAELIAKDVDMSLRTVKTYWNLFKDVVKEYNNNLKASISIKKDKPISTSDQLKKVTKNVTKEVTNDMIIIAADDKGNLSHIKNFDMKLPEPITIGLKFEDDDEITKTEAFSIDGKYFLVNEFNNRKEYLNTLKSEEIIIEEIKFNDNVA